MWYILQIVYVRIAVHKSFEQAFDRVIIYHERNGFKTERNLTWLSYDCNICKLFNISLWTGSLIKEGQRESEKKEYPSSLGQFTRSQFLHGPFSSGQTLPAEAC